MLWVVKATPRPLYSRERPGNHCIGDCVGLRACLEGCGKSRSQRDLIPGRPARSELLYGLRSPGPRLWGKFTFYFVTHFPCLPNIYQHRYFTYVFIFLAIIGYLFFYFCIRSNGLEIPYYYLFYVMSCSSLCKIWHISISSLQMATRQTQAHSILTGVTNI